MPASTSKPLVHVVHRRHVPGTPRHFDRDSLGAVQDMVAEALDAVGFAGEVRHRRVLIKPNLVRPNPDFPSATTTDPRVIIACLRLCRDAGARAVGIGDKPGIGLSCRRGEILLGLGDYLEETGARFVYFDESEEIWEANPKAHLQPAHPVPAVLRDYEVILNLPKLKLHMHTGVSLGVKNLFGLVPEHFRLKHHREDLHRFLVDYLYLVNPDFTLIDGIWALEGQAPICGTPVKDFNTLIASKNIVAADAAGAWLMGVEPREIAMIRIAAEEGFGPCSVGEIRFTGKDPAQIQRHFRRPIVSSQSVYPGINVQVRGGCIGCLSSLRHALDRLHLAGQLREDQHTILLGFHHQAEESQSDVLRGTLWCYGECCREIFQEGFRGRSDVHFLEGCPPHFMDFYRAYCRVTGSEPK